jgi:hypothetical protein
MARPPGTNDLRATVTHVRQAVSHGISLRSDAGCRTTGLSLLLPDRQPRSIGAGGDRATGYTCLARTAAQEWRLIFTCRHLHILDRLARVLNGEAHQCAER